MRIDSHQHFWNLQKDHYSWPTPDLTNLFRNIEAPELEPLLKQAGIDKTVIVQANDTYADTAYMLDTARRYDWVGGVVGWVRLLDPDEAGRKLEELTQDPHFKGIRHLIHMEPDPDWVVQDRVIEGLKLLASFGLSFDLVAVYPNHLSHVPALCEKVPNLMMVIDHLAKPPIKEKQMGAWADQMAAAAAYPQVYAKVSGLNTAADWETWTAGDIKPYIDFAIEKFSPQRLMFGSDWPVANLAGDYLKVWNETQKALQGYSHADIEAILGGTAAKFYRISE